MQPWRRLKAYWVRTSGESHGGHPSKEAPMLSRVGCHPCLPTHLPTQGSSRTHRVGPPRGEPGATYLPPWVGERARSSGNSKPRPGCSAGGVALPGSLWRRKPRLSPCPQSPSSPIAPFLGVLLSALSLPARMEGRGCRVLGACALAPSRALARREERRPRELREPEKRRETEEARGSRVRTHSAVFLRVPERRLWLWRRCGEGVP